MSETTFFKGTRVYLSGPMDFVPKRDIERATGWRARIKGLMQSYGATVYDPWDKPDIRGLHEYGQEDIKMHHQRQNWSFADTEEGAVARAKVASYFWETQHIDLRMVDVSDFVIAYCPSNIYSVGTAHEIIMARGQHKPVLIVSPPILLPALENLRRKISGNAELEGALDELVGQVPIRENPTGTPSLWYMPLVHSEYFFDGFGFNNPLFWERFPSWGQDSELNRRETQVEVQRPLVPYLEKLSRGEEVPRRWDHLGQKFVADDDWLIMEDTHASREDGDFGRGE
jgi:hypothetical protein